MRCANPACQVEALYLRSGNIYCIDREVEGSGECDVSTVRAQRQMIWLCPDCSQSCVVETWRKPGQQLRWLYRQTPRPRPVMNINCEQKVAA